MAAQVTTLPVILLNFERLSLIAPAANVLVVPLVPLVMLGSALAALAGAVGAALPLAGPVEWLTGGVAFCLLRAMVVVGQAAAAVPLASVELTGPPWLAAAWYPALFMARGRLAAAADRVCPARTTRYRWQAGCWRASPGRCRWPCRRWCSSED